jgi:hypothetical protein
MVATVQQYEKPGISILAIIALLVVSMMLIKAIKSLPAAGGRSAYAPLALPPGQHAAQFSAGAHDMANAISASAHQHQGYAPAIAEPLAFPEQNQTRGRVAATIAAKPEVSTRVVRAWLKEAV